MNKRTWKLCGRQGFASTLTFNWPRLIGMTVGLILLFSLNASMASLICASSHPSKTFFQLTRRWVLLDGVTNGQHWELLLQGPACWSEQKSELRPSTKDHNSVARAIARTSSPILKHSIAEHSIRSTKLCGVIKQLWLQSADQSTDILTISDF